MSEEKDVSLDINDIDRATQAIQIANKRGAFELAESGALAGIVARLTAWTTSYRAQHEEAADAASKETPQV